MKAQIIQQYGCFMTCMSLSGVIASPTWFAALPAVAEAGRALRVTFAQRFVRHLFIEMPSRRIARKSAHSVSFPLFSLSILFCRSEQLHASMGCAFAWLIDSARRCLTGTARALQWHLALSSATKVGYSRGRCGGTPLWACKAAVCALGGAVGQLPATT